MDKFATTHFMIVSSTENKKLLEAMVTKELAEIALLWLSNIITFNSVGLDKLIIGINETNKQYRKRLVQNCTQSYNLPASSFSFALN